MINAKEIEQYYGSGESRFCALKKLNLQIPDSEFAVILGASGSGKSTLLYVLSGLDRPESGSVFYDDTDIAKLSDRERTAFRRKNIGFIFQQYYLLPQMDVEQNVRMGADLVHNKDYASIIEAVGLKEKRHKYPQELSGGEQQRAAIARALAKQPKYLFLDEPTGALDEQTGRQVLNYICNLQKELGFTAVMVTHNQNIAELAGTVIHMNSGNISAIHPHTQRKSAYEIGW